MIDFASLFPLEYEQNIIKFNGSQPLDALKTSSGDTNFNIYF